MEDINCIFIPSFYQQNKIKNQNMVDLFISGEKCQTAKLIPFYQLWGGGGGIFGIGWG